MAVLSFQNGLRLHNNSIVLYNNESYPSAFSLSILSLEEIGKYFLIEDFVFYSTTDKRYSPEVEEEIIKSIYYHHPKQMKFARQSSLSRLSMKIVEDMYDGKFEKLKQVSIYVGLPRINGRIDLNGRISSPHKISNIKVKKQITRVNDFIICLSAGVVKGFYGVDIDKLEEILNHDLINKYRNLWPDMSRSSAAIFNRFMRYPDFTIE